MHAERALPEPKLELPQDLLAELRRRGTAPSTELHVEGWKPSFMGRLFALFGGRRAR
jgi:hypothetical protein